MSATCESCRAPIRWAQTEKGKLIPIDYEPVRGGNLLLVALDPRDAPLARPATAQDSDTLERFVSHFASCPNADRHRRPRGAA